MGQKKDFIEDHGHGVFVKFGIWRVFLVVTRFFKCCVHCEYAIKYFCIDWCLIVCASLSIEWDHVLCMGIGYIVLFLFN